MFGGLMGEIYFQWLWEEANFYNVQMMNIFMILRTSKFSKRFQSILTREVKIA